MVCVCVWC
uniref:Uncharacterized protein n=1 Tax=Arundo donax TaxID=35708 RepID=A0A0A8YZ10_ARUDO